MGVHRARNADLLPNNRSQRPAAGGADPADPVFQVHCGGKIEVNPAVPVGGDARHGGQGPAVHIAYRGRDGLSPVEAELAAMTNPAGHTGSAEVALRGADVFIGLPGSTIAESVIAAMAPGAPFDERVAPAVAAAVAAQAGPAARLPLVSRACLLSPLRESVPMTR